MRYFKILFIFLTLLVESGYSQEKEYINGSWWVRLNDLQRLPFLTGFIDGISLGYDLTIKDFKPNSICAMISEEAFSATAILDTIPILWIMDQMDHFYKDTSNLSIPCYHAFWIAAQQVAGRDSTSIKKFRDFYRKEDNQHNNKK